MFKPIARIPGYFGRSTVIGAEIVERPVFGRSAEEIIELFNRDPARDKNHSAHLLIYDFGKNGNRKPIAFKCNCGAGVFHLVDANCRPLWSTPVKKEELNAIKRGEIPAEYIVGTTFEL
jgi:hypothetical protein